MRTLPRRRSNTGEGGEDEDRLLDPVRRSAIKQVASGRFGVTSLYLTQASDIQIKMAQGAKPGERRSAARSQGLPMGRQDPSLDPRSGAYLAPSAPRHLLHRGPCTADSRSQECQSAGTRARQARGGDRVGTVAAGVSKAHADVVLISGMTEVPALRRSRRSSNRWWAMGAWTSRDPADVGCSTACVSGSWFRSDGQLKTGRDVVIAALLGAEEFGLCHSSLSGQPSCVQ